MKILYFIVSINLAAATTVGTQLGASADSEAMSDQANWLKTSIGSLGSNDSQSKATLSKLVGEKAVAQSLTTMARQSHTKAIVLAGQGGTVKLMPFVPNRKLPSKRDLEVALVRQTAQMAPEANKPLAGQVSLFDSYAATNPSAQNRTITSASGSKWASKRTWSNLMAATKASFSASKGSALSFPFLKQAEHQLLDQTAESPSQSDDLQPVSSKPAVNLDQQMLDQYSQLQLKSRLTQSNHASLSNSQPSHLLMNDQFSSQGGVSESTAGPAPFPLSLLPQASLKQLMRGMASHPKASGPAAYFGCWHNSSGLPTGAFHQYAPPVGTYNGFGQRAQWGFRTQRSTNSSRQSNQVRTANYANGRSLMQRGVSMTRIIAAARAYPQTRLARVASYPAYSTANQYMLY